MAADGTSFSPNAGIAALTPADQWAMCERVVDRVLRGPEGRHMSKARKAHLREELPGEIFILALDPDAIAGREERHRRAGVRIDTIVTEAALLRVATNHVREARRQFVRRRDYLRSGLGHDAWTPRLLDGGDDDEGDSDDCGGAAGKVVLVERGMGPELWCLAYQEVVLLAQEQPETGRTRHAHAPRRKPKPILHLKHPASPAGGAP